MSCNTPCNADRMRRRLLLGMLAAASAQASTLARAQNPAPARPPQPLPGSRLQGQATLRFLGLRIYDAKLWTLPSFAPLQWAAHPLVLQLDYHRAFQGSAIAERSLQEMRRAGPLSAAQAQQWLSAMQALFPNVQAGEQIMGHYLPGQGARFWHQGQALGPIDDAAFARLFFGIWLAEHTSEPAMRRALLGLRSDETAQ